MTLGKPVTTGKLIEAIKGSVSFEQFKKDYSHDLSVPSLAEYLNTLCRARKEPSERVIKRAELDRVYGHQIFSGLKNPTRDKVIQLAFGFDFDVEQTQVLLRVACKSLLYPRIERDAVILYCLDKKMSVLETQLMLSEMNLHILGGEEKRD